MMTHKLYRRKDQPDSQGATELDWIDSEVRILGKSFGRARKSIRDEIERGTLVEVPSNDQSPGRPYIG